MSDDPVWGDEEIFPVVLPPNGDFSERLVRLAERVWSSTHLRSSIIEHLDRKSMLRFLTLDKTSFPEIVRILYRAMHYTDYLTICQPHVTDTRRELYVQAIRELDIRGAMPLLGDVQGFSHLLDLFPLATRIRAECTTLVISVRHIPNDQPSTSLVILYVKVVLVPLSFTNGLWTPEFKHPAFPNWRVVFDVDFPFEEVDWDLARWDDVDAANFEPNGKPQALLVKKGSGKISAASMLSRNIESLSDWRCRDLDTLSDHLARRRTLGFYDLTLILLTKVGAEAGPLSRFILRNPSLESFSCLEYSDEVHADWQFSQFLLSDWSRLESETMPSLRDLVVNINIEADRVPDSGELIEEAIKQRCNNPPFAKLNTLILLIRMQYETACVEDPSISSIPRYSQIAEALVQIFGTDFVLEVEFEGMPRRMSAAMRSQLTKEVLYRQRKEREKPRLRKQSPP